MCFVCCRTPVSCGAPWSHCPRPAGWSAVWLKSCQRTTPSTAWPCTLWRLWRPSPLRTDPERERAVETSFEGVAIVGRWRDDNEENEKKNKGKKASCAGDRFRQRCYMVTAERPPPSPHDKWPSHPLSSLSWRLDFVFCYSAHVNMINSSSQLNCKRQWYICGYDRLLTFFLIHHILAHVLNIVARLILWEGY